MLFIQLIYYCIFHVAMFPPLAWLHLSVYNPRVTHSFSIRSDEGLTPGILALGSLYGGKFTLTTQLIKQNAYCGQL